MGRRHMKKVPQNGTVASHERYLYRGYLQIAALDMLDNRNVLRTLLWDPLEPVATRPLALAQGASLYCYGVDFNKNVTEVFDAQGTIAAAYDYSPYGAVTSTGSLVQPVQWSWRDARRRTRPGLLQLPLLQPQRRQMDQP